MTLAQALRAAYTDWHATYELLHGPLSADETDVAQQVAEYLILVAQTLDDLPEGGTPYQSDVEVDATL